jgi:hypothetical protein
MLESMRPNNALERQRGSGFGKGNGMLQFWINQLRSASAKPRVAQRARWASGEIVVVTNSTV